MNSKMLALSLAVFHILFVASLEVSYSQRKTDRHRSPGAQLQATPSISVAPLHSLSSSSTTRSLAFSYDGSVLASGHTDGTINLWKTNGGALLRVLKTRDKAVTALAFSPDGELLASGGEDSSIVIQSANEGSVVQTLKGIDQNCGITEVIKSLSFSPDGSMLAYGSSCAIALWRVRDWSILRVLKHGEIGGADSINFFQGGQNLLADNRLFRVADGTLLKTLGCYGPRSVSLSKEITACIDSSSFDRIRISTLQDERQIRELSALPRKNYELGGISHAAFMPSGSVFVSSGSGAWRDKGWETTIRFWDVGTGKILYNETIPLLDTMAMALSPDGRMLAAGGYLYPSDDESGVIRMWQIGKGEVNSQQANPINAETSAVSGSNNWIGLSRGQKRSQFQFSRSRTLLYNGRQLVGVKFKSTVQKIAISPPAVGGKYTLCVTFDDMESAAFLLRLDDHSGRQLALQGPPSVWAAWSPTGTHAVIGSYYEADETLYSISLPSGIVRRFSFNLATQTEEENYDLDNLSWVDGKVFRFRLTVNCNPYTDDNCSDKDRRKVLREYEIRANVVTLAASTERIR